MKTFTLLLELLDARVRMARDRTSSSRSATSTAYITVISLEISTAAVSQRKLSQFHPSLQHQRVPLLHLKYSQQGAHIYCRCSIGSYSVCRRLFTKRPVWLAHHIACPRLPYNPFSKSECQKHETQVIFTYYHEGFSYFLRT